MKLLSLAALFVIAVAISFAVLTGFARRGSAGGVGGWQPEGLPKTKQADKGKEPMFKYSKSAYDITHLSQAKIDQLAKKLKPDEAEVILAKGTERAFCGNLYDNHKDGVY